VVTVGITRKAGNCAAGEAKPELIEGGTRVFLVKVLNQAGVTSPLAVESPNNGPVYIKSDSSAEPPRI